MERSNLYLPHSSAGSRGLNCDIYPRGLEGRGESMCNFTVSSGEIWSLPGDRLINSNEENSALPNQKISSAFCLYESWGGREVTAVKKPLTLWVLSIPFVFCTGATWTHSQFPILYRPDFLHRSSFSCFYFRFMGQGALLPDIFFLLYYYIIAPGMAC